MVSIVCYNPHLTKHVNWWQIVAHVIYINHINVMQVGRKEFIENEMNRV